MSTPTMSDLYPDGRGYHSAHAAYIDAVAAALDAAGFTTVRHHADANDPRDGAIQLEAGSTYDEVWLGWQEERAWTVLTVTEFAEPRLNKGRWQTDSRNVYDLHCALVASPASVVKAFAEWSGLSMEVADDGHPDVAFPDHSFDEDDVEFELALRRYAALPEDGTDG